MQRQLQKYLRTRAIRTPWEIAGSLHNKFQAAIIIPSLAESASLPETLASLATNQKKYLQQTLILIVINNRTDIPIDQQQDNQTTLVWLKSKPFPQLNLAWIDASSPGLELPQKQGVGLARKIGFDLALQQLDWSQSPLLISLDADTLVEENYLAAIFSHFEQSNQAGATVPFRHQPAATSAQEQAIRNYELYLRSYLFGLQQAGSPYAYHAIGSAFVCRAQAYIAAGGMNRRQAGEDFYFLQQLAKIGGVEILRGTIVHPSPRFSLRVPFGTGRAVQEQVEQGEMVFRFISKRAFVQLRGWLQLVTQQWTSSAQQLLDASALLAEPLVDFLLQLDFITVWQKLQQNHSDKDHFLAGFHGWFDALRTRQLLHCLDQVGPRPIDTVALVDELLVWGGYAGKLEELDQLCVLEQFQS